MGGSSGPPGSVGSASSDGQQPIALVVAVLGPVAQRVDDDPQIAGRVVGETPQRSRLADARRRAHFADHAAEGVIAVLRRPAQRVGDAEQLPGRVVREFGAHGRQAAGRVGPQFLDQPLLAVVHVPVTPPRGSITLVRLPSGSYS